MCGQTTAVQTTTVSAGCDCGRGSILNVNAVPGNEHVIALKYAFTASNACV